MQSIVFAEESAGGDLRSADAALLSGENQLAIDRYNSAISTHELEGTALAKALLNKALAEQRLKLHREAIDDYTAALDSGALITAERAVALYNRGLSHHLLSELSLAIEDYTSALFLAPKMPQAFMSRGNALRESGQYLFALSDYERAARYGHPDLARVHYATAVTYMALSRNKEAERELTLALEANPGHSAAQQKLDELKRQTRNDQASSPETDQAASAYSHTLGSTELSKPDNAPAVSPPAELAQQTETRPQTQPVTASMAPDTVAAEPQPAAPNDPIVANGTPEPVAAPPPPANEQLATLPSAEPEIQTASTTAAAGDGSTPADIAPPALIPAEANSGWSVQLGSASSDEGARATWAKMQKKFASLRGLTPAFIRADLGTKGVFFRIRQMGFVGADDAKKACQEYKKSGISCFVSQIDG